MAAAVEMPLEVADEGAIATLRQIRRESEQVADTLKKAFAADVAVEGLGRLSRAFGGVAGAAVDAGGAIARGFLQGGLAGGVGSTLIVAVEKATLAFNAEEEAATKAAQARLEAIGAETKRLDDVNGRLAETLRLRATELEIIALGGEVGEAQKKLEVDRTNQRVREAQRASDAVLDEERKLLREETKLNDQRRRLGDAFPESFQRELEAIRARRREITGEQGDRARALAALETANKEREELTERFRLEDQAASESARAAEEAKRLAGIRDLAHKQHEIEVDAAKRRAAAIAAVEESLAAEKRHLIDAEAEITRLANLQMWADGRAAAERELASIEAEALAEAEITRIANEHITRLNREADNKEESARQNALDSEKAAAAERYQYAQIALSGTQALIDTVWGLEEAQKNATAVELEEQAKRAAVKAIMATAEAALAIYFNDPKGAVAAGFAAAQFAIVAGSSAAAAGSAPAGDSNRPPQIAPGSDVGGFSRSSSSSSSSRSSRSSRDRGAVTLVYNASSGTYATREDVSRDVQALIDAANRRR
jgi:hypothetical protein